MNSDLFKKLDSAREKAEKAKIDVDPQVFTREEYQANRKITEKKAREELNELVLAGVVERTKRIQVGASGVIRPSPAFRYLSPEEETPDSK